jgi:hypothetical protein
MFNDIKQSKIDKFLNDETLVEVIYSEIKKELLKSHNCMEVNVLAAERLAIMYFDEAWKSLLKNKTKVQQENKQIVQVGL